jgi:hypothetical protein
MVQKRDGTAREAGAISLSQASTNFGHSSARLRRIKKLQFGIINPEELRQYSVTQAITVNGRKIPAGVTRYEVRISIVLFFRVGGEMWGLVVIVTGDNLLFVSFIFVLICELMMTGCIMLSWPWPMVINSTKGLVLISLSIMIIFEGEECIILP